MKQQHKHITKSLKMFQDRAKLERLMWASIPRNVPCILYQFSFIESSQSHGLCERKECVCTLYAMATDKEASLFVISDVRRDIMQRAEHWKLGGITWISPVPSVLFQGFQRCKPRFSALTLYTVP